MVGWEGLEPSTNALKGLRSTSFPTFVYRCFVNVVKAVAKAVDNKRPPWQ